MENKALLDSGCPELVAGLAWVKTLENSHEKVFEEVEREERFKFGDKVFDTITFKKIPLKLGKLSEEVEVGVVAADVPLLISKRKLTEWGGILDFQSTIHIRKTAETIKLE